MPFTPSHAVVALPFVRTPLVPAAIAIGSMTPDLPLFIGRIGVSYGVTHAWSWLPTTVLLAGVLLLAWRCLLRPAVRELSPAWLARRLPSSWDGGAGAALRETFPSLRGVVLLTVSLPIGVASHIVWDMFTHEGRAGVALLPVLDAEWGPLLGYKWIQYGSGVIGLAIIAAWMLVWLSRQEAATSVTRIVPTWIRWTWWLSLPIVLVVAWVGGWLMWGPFSDTFTPSHLVYRVLPQAAGVWGFATLLLAVAVQLLRRRRVVATGAPAPTR